MKQFYLICMLLLVSLATFGRDVTVHVTDQRGAAVSGLPVQFDNENFDTDVKGWEVRVPIRSGIIKTIIMSQCVFLGMVYPLPLM